MTRRYVSALVSAMAAECHYLIVTQQTAIIETCWDRPIHVSRLVEWVVVVPFLAV